MLMTSSSSCSYTRKTPSSSHTKTGNKLKKGENGVVNRKALSREKRIALQQDVEKLRKKLRLEENIHRAMERAFSRPLGTLPRLSPFLPPSILELLAEVAVLEEEIVRLEEQILHCRQEFYQESDVTSSSKTNLESSAGLAKHWQTRRHKSKPVSCNAKESESSCLSASESQRGKENQLRANSTIKMSVMKSLVGHTQPNKSLESQKLQQESHTRHKTRSYGVAEENCEPNRLSEDLVNCLSNIFMRMSSAKSQAVTKSKEHDKDPYGICSGFRRRDIGAYKNFRDVEAASINRNRTSSSSLSLTRQLKHFLGRLSSVNLQKLNQQEKLVFWINIYNSCIMNAFIEHGIPESPEMMVTLMQKATINVGGHFLNAITIENFILRSPYHLKSIYPKGSKENEIAARNKLGLKFSEPLVSFAFSCGS